MQYTHVRQRARGLLNRLYRALAVSVAPEHFYVRGRGVAQGHLLQAMQRCGPTGAPVWAFVDDSNADDLTKAITSSPSAAGSKFTVARRSLLRDDVLDKYGLNLLIELAGNSPFAFRVRNRYSSRILPVLSIQHGLNREGYIFERVVRLLLANTYRCDSLVCSSEVSKKALQNLLCKVAGDMANYLGGHVAYNGRIDCIPLCVDTDRFAPRSKAPARAVVGIDKNAFVVLCVGYLSLHKSDWFSLLPCIKAFIQRSSARKRFFVFAGTGQMSYIKALSEQIEALGLSRNVTVKVNVTDSMIDELFASADVFVSISDTLQESFGLAPVEAMACGVPQVVADWDGFRETVVHGKTGFLIPTYWTKCDSELHLTGEIMGGTYDGLLLGQSIAIDRVAFIDALETLAENRRLCMEMGAHSRERAVSEFSYSAVMKRHIALWTELERESATCMKHRVTDDYDRPAYWDVFSHYASIHINRASRIRSREGFDEIGLRRVERASGYSGFLDVKVFRMLLDILNPRSQALGMTLKDVEVGELQEHLRMHGVSPDVTARHIMWLLKYGVVELVTWPEDR